MPLVRIDLNKDAPAERVQIVSRAAQGAMIEIANIPINDKFQIEGLGTLANPIVGEV
jgi:4-oxalocrotonate tautomerase